jgi:hypothetical protein
MNDPVAAAFQSVLGLPSWEVKRGHGSFLTMHFGSPEVRTGPGSGTTAQPADPKVIHLGGQAAVVVPVTDFLRLRALELQASAEELADASAPADWKTREAAGQTAYVPHDEVPRRLGLRG